jgi:alpha-D-xyloside xylohydrolase
MRCCLRGGLSAGLSGEAFWSHDIGGFCGDKPSPELYARWAQLGMFSPLTRFHGTTPREPWEYGEEAEKIVVSYAKIRYGLMPYILTAAKESYSTGVPMMRHMALEFPKEPNVHTLDDQFMLGSELLVAPILNNGQRNRFVYLPKGQWTELEDNSKTYEGGRFIEVEAPLNKIPVFVREGAIIPRYKDEIQHLKENNSEVQIDIYSGKRNNMLHFTDGSKDIKLAANLERSDIQLLVSGDTQKLNLNLIGVEVKKINCDEADFRWTKTQNGAKVLMNCEKATLIKIM